MPSGRRGRSRRNRRRVIIGRVIGPSPRSPNYRSRRRVFDRESTGNRVVTSGLLNHPFVLLEKLLDSVEASEAGRDGTGDGGHAAERDDKSEATHCDGTRTEMI